MAVSVCVWAKVYVDNSGDCLSIPMLILADHGLLESHLRYLIKNRFKSKSWQMKSIKSLRLLIEFSHEYFGVYGSPLDLFNDFSDKVFFGTCDAEGNDSIGLRWRPRSAPDARDILNHVKQFSDFILEMAGSEEALLTPWIEAGNFNASLNLAAYHHKKNRAFLSHLINRPNLLGKNSSKRSQFHNSVDLTRVGPPICFDEELLPQFLAAFSKSNSVEDVVNEITLNLRDILIVMLMHFGGLRSSEPFHLFVHDVIEDPERPRSALVKVFHPNQGTVSLPNGNKTKMTRAKYLMDYFGLEDRLTSKNRGFHSGWKSPLLDNYKDQYFVVQWFPVDSGVLFLSIWKKYLATQYIAPKKSENHPFAFTNQFGGPASLKQFNESYRRAVKRLGLSPTKEGGTTPHAHRHAYGQRLRKAGLSPFIIKRAMHHCSIESQLTYTQSSQEEVRHELSRASKILLELTPEKSIDVSLDNTNQYPFFDKDPLGIFSQLSGFKKN